MSKAAFDLDHLVQLARLPLDQAKKKRFQSQLGEILDYVEQIKKVETDQAGAASTTITGLQNVFREDKPDKTQCLPQSQALKNAPVVKDGYFKVKSVFDSEQSTDNR